jgi:dTDP-4-amino-4,6-dideoxygalactose transaminase
MIPTHRPSLTQSDLGAVIQAFNYGDISDGPTTRKFETALAVFLGLPGGVATNSCSSAITLALRALGAQGGEVILPSLVCSAVYNAVIQAGCHPVVVDNYYEPHDMNYNIASWAIDAATTNATRTIIIPHMFGTPAWASQFGTYGDIPIIEDITQSIGASYPGFLDRVGSFGHCCVCSFHSSKMLCAGEGGMLLSQHSSFLEKCRDLNSSRMSGLNAALGLSQLDSLSEGNKRRRAIANQYLDFLMALELKQHEIPFNARSVFWHYLLTVPEGTVDDYRARFCAEGVQVGRSVVPPLHRLTGAKCPNAERAANTLISLPIYPSLTDHEIGLVMQACEKILG